MDMHFDGVIFQTHARELGRRIGRAHPPFAVLDVRPAEEHAAGHVPGARSVGPEDLKGFPEGTGAETEFFVLGQGPADTGVRAASLALKGLGARRVVEIPAGLLEWRRLGLPLESGQERAA